MWWYIWSTKHREQEGYMTCVCLVEPMTLVPLIHIREKPMKIMTQKGVEY
jgi:hypothetical protein